MQKNTMEITLVASQIAGILPLLMHKLDSAYNLIRNESSKNELMTGISYFCVNNQITHDVMQLVENRLVEAYGPVTNLLLKSTAKKSKCVGELFLTLTQNQKLFFFRNIECLDNSFVSEV